MTQELQTGLMRRDGLPTRHQRLDTSNGSSNCEADKRLFVYFIQAGSDGPIKIGVAKNPLDRLSSLQTASAVPLSLLGVIAGGYTLERKLHKRFAACLSHGEWFHGHPSVVLEITELLKQQGCKPPARARAMLDADVVAEARRIVLEAARPVEPGDSIKRQKDKAFDRLDLGSVKAGRSILHRAWNNQSGFPTLQLLRVQAQKVGLKY